jgi:tetratricopeptide (TPR) repeat protein
MAGMSRILACCLAALCFVATFVLAAAPTHAQIAEAERIRKQEEAKRLRLEALLNDPLGCDKLASHPYQPALQVPGVEFNALKQQSADAIKVCSAALTKSPQSPKYMYLLGRALQADEKFDEALKLYNQSAELNYGPALANIGFMLTNGIGVAKNEQDAMTWYQKAASQNFAPAQHHVGVAHIDGKYAPRNKALGIEWLKKAAAGNYPAAQKTLNKIRQEEVQIEITMNKGKAFISDNPSTWQYKEEKDRMTGTLTTTATSRQYAEGNIVAEVTAQCDKINDAPAVIFLTTLLPTVEGSDLSVVNNGESAAGPMGLDLREASGQTRRIRIRKNDTLTVTPVPMIGFTNAFISLIVKGARQKDLSMYPDIEVVRTEAWGALLEFATNRGKIIVTIPITAPEIRHVIQSCLGD